MARNFKSLRQQKPTTLNFRQWEYDGFKFKTILPTPRIDMESESVSRKVFYSLLKDSEMTDDQLMTLAENKDLFQRTEEKYGGKLDDIDKNVREQIINLQSELDKIAPESLDSIELKNTPKWDRAVEISEELDKLRKQLIEVFNVRNGIISGSAESQSDRSKQNYVITHCTFVDAKEEGAEQPVWIPVWSSMEEFLDEEDGVLIQLARMEFTLFSMGLQNDLSTLDDKFPENRILRIVRNVEVVESTTNDTETVTTTSNWDIISPSDDNVQEE